MLTKVVNTIQHLLNYNSKCHLNTLNQSIMKSKLLPNLKFLLIAAALFLFVTADLFAQGSVSRSGSTWTARVNGNTVYTGTRMFDAINAACNNMGAGTINIWNSGSSGPSGGSIYAIRPGANQTLDFHGHSIHCDGGDLIVAIHADRRNNITIRNLHVTGAPRYGMWFRGCSGVTLHNITMNLSHPGAVGLGIRVDNSTGAASNLTISGNININGSLGHAIETYGVDGISIGDVTVTNTAVGCGVILNNSRNATIGTINGFRNNRGGGYATFRVANNNGPNIRVQKVISRESGRGFFSVSGSYDCVVNEVDIANNTSHGIFLEDATDTHVLSGTVVNCNPNTQMVRTTRCSINLGSGSGDNNARINGRYAVVAVHSGKALDVYNWGTSDGTNIVQWDYWGGGAQQFNISSVDGDWHRISPVIATSKALDVDGISTANGANIHIWNYWGGNGQQFRFQNAGSGRYRIIARHSNKCLDVYGASSANGANIIQWECISGATNQMFELVRLGSLSSSPDETKYEMNDDYRNVMVGLEDLEKVSEEIRVFPNPTRGSFKIHLAALFIEGITNITILDIQGRKVYSESVSQKEVEINEQLNPGLYFIYIENGNNSTIEKIIVK
ncbi:Por secretion system C-terminal sorting domain-containing protein [Alkalitalea saponilacus]|uniref:Por secretion system C-terminal sorting domain-containing protein n=2 Tax=Alkalitalea saponilacus TaxID=889453 RepID=A0A1T5DG26_9BACT|nr:Por secretion system C-terminal sorting domain-containing protein [Alkalitalea saponilacus]